MLTKTCSCGCNRTFQVYPYEYESRRFYSQECWRKSTHTTHCTNPNCGVELTTENRYKSDNLCKKCRYQENKKYRKETTVDKSIEICKKDDQDRGDIASWLKYYKKRKIQFEMEWGMVGSRKNMKIVAHELFG